MVVWKILKRKRRVACQPVLFNETNLNRVLLSSAVEATEKPPQPRTMESPTTDTRLNDVPELEQRGEPTDAEENIPPIASGIDTTEGQRLGVPSVGILRHTDSGWRPTLQRHFQPSGTGSGRLLEMPPSYSEAA
ncbi:hypothetical protein PM082_015004 [Marasmius tenuissimus]|nr:hypothetical protein PM082_015004 [Marasmius tenuissimus]